MGKRKIVNGTSYNENTSDEVIRILEDARESRRRIRLFYGDTKTGADWCETFETIGRIGRSCGDEKIPIILSKESSIGGPAILDNCIVKITMDKTTVYKNPKYHLPDLTISEAEEKYRESGFTHAIFSGEITLFNFRNEQRAERMLEFLKGNRNRV